MAVDTIKAICNWTTFLPIMENGNTTFPFEGQCVRGVGMEHKMCSRSPDLGPKPYVLQLFEL
jgi:hypothetical protein